MSQQQKFGKIIWNSKEQITLPHFFLNERYMEDFITKRVNSMCNYPWGFEELELDISEISLGRIGIARARGLLQDGTPFDIPNTDPVPPSVSVHVNLMGNKRELMLYLALPLNKPELTFKNYYNSERFIERELTLDNKKYKVAANRFQILIGEDEIKNYTCLPFARVDKINPDGSLHLSSLFIPPVLNILKNKFLESLIFELHSLVRQKARSLAEMYVSVNGVKNSVTPQVTDALMLQILNRTDGYFDCLRQKPMTHPQDFYTEMVLFSSELATYTLHNRLAHKFIDYNHMELEINFFEIRRVIQEQLNATLERDATEVMLRISNVAFWHSVFIPSELLHNSYYILAVSTRVNTQELLQYFTGRLKVSATSRIESHFKGMTTGMKVEPLSTIPPSIPYNHECVYFQIMYSDESRQEWQQMFNEQAISFHATGDYPDLQLQLWLVKKDKMNG